ncbi:MAG: hypothetical protein J6C40_12080 [Lentisphaeria bacterium]|nr:hypothetical protein [Lentisphaeria bacterium]
MESIDQTNLDRMFFALSELKKNGIYWCIDLLTNRQIKSGDYPEFAGETFYTYSIFMPRLIELQKEFITKLFTTRNPYTGKTLAEAPALVMLIIQNEDSLLYQPNRNRIKHPLALAELKRRFNAYLREKYQPRNALAAAWKNTLKLNRPARGLTVHALDYSGKKIAAPVIREENGTAVIELTGAPHYELTY